MELNNEGMIFTYSTIMIAGSHILFSVLVKKIILFGDTFISWRYFDSSTTQEISTKHSKFYPTRVRMHMTLFSNQYLLFLIMIIMKKCFCTKLKNYNRMLPSRLVPESGFLCFDPDIYFILLYPVPTVRTAEVMNMYCCCLHLKLYRIKAMSFVVKETVI